MKIIKEISISVVFVILLLIPLLQLVFGVFPDIENHENRAMAGLPSGDSLDISTFPLEFDEYYTDNFQLRNQLLKLNSKLKFQVFNVPPIEGKAFIGRMGWMYYIKKELDIYLGNNLADNVDLQRYYDIFTYRRNFLDSIGTKYYVVIAPIKTSVYPEYLPLSKRKNNQETLTDQIVRLLDTVSGITIIDLRKPLIEAKGAIRLFHKTDNHWNDYGSYIGYLEIMKELKKDFPQLMLKDQSNFRVDSVESEYMGLAKMMGIYDGVSEQKILCEQLSEQISFEGEKSNYRIPEKFPYRSNFEVVYNVANDSLPSMLLIRDSFGKTVMPYLREHFSRSTYIFDGWVHQLHEEMVINEKPDIYVQMMVESFIPNVKAGAKKP